MLNLQIEDTNFWKVKKSNIFGTSIVTFVGKRLQPIKNALFTVQRICDIGYVKSVLTISKKSLIG